ncbi:MAG TPA: hypothetical protein VFZ32_07980, partial [Micromonosporaceae bacterium]
MAADLTEQHPRRSSVDRRGRLRHSSDRPGWLRRSFDRYWYAWAMVLPVTVVLGVLIFYPLLRGVWMSLTNLNESNQ